MNIPVIIVNQDKARDAYLAYLGLLAHEAADPGLRFNSTWSQLKRITLERYTAAHELQGAA